MSTFESVFLVVKGSLWWRPLQILSGWAYPSLYIPPCFKSKTTGIFMFGLWASSHGTTPLYRGRCRFTFQHGGHELSGWTLLTLFCNEFQNLPPWRVFFGFIPFPDTQRAAKKERPPKLQTPFRMVAVAIGGLWSMRNKGLTFKLCSTITTATSQFGTAIIRQNV